MFLRVRKDVKNTISFSVGGEENFCPSMVSAFCKCVQAVLYVACVEADTEAAKALVVLSCGVPGGNADGDSLKSAWGTLEYLGVASGFGRDLLSHLVIDLPFLVKVAPFPCLSWRAAALPGAASTQIGSLLTATTNLNGMRTAG